MSQRRTCSDRPRGWSQESGSSQEEVVVFQGNRAIKPPERQPKVPPTEHCAQKDEGFARFLKKHSSPTHQRVTTGGRIVPMEQQLRPPVFSLQHQTQETEDTKTAGTDRVTGMKNLAAVGHDPAPAGAPDNMHHPQPQRATTLTPVTTRLADPYSFNAGTNGNEMASNALFGFDVNTIPPTFLQTMPSMPYYVGMPADQHNAMLMHSQMFQGGAMPFGAFNAAAGPGYPVPFMPTPPITGLPHSGGITTNPTDPLPQGGSYAEHMQSEAIATFQLLNEQLQNLDRARAMMHDKDPQVVEQRMKIVQLRAEAKEAIGHWSKVLGQGAPLGSQLTAGAPNSRLNVQASAYVPLRAQQTAETSSDNSGTSLKPNGVEKWPNKPDFVVDSTRRPIPIVPPPAKSPSPQKNGKGDAGSKFGSIEVDEWGVRVGPAPLEIQHKQSQMLKELVRQGSISPPESGGDVALLTPPPQPNAVKEIKMDAEFDSESEWLPTKPGRAPATVEACYEVQLNAMRLPAGLVSKVRLPDGTITEVRGCGLKRPSSRDMDEFEQHYWNAKPELTEDIFENIVEVRGYGADGDTANLIDQLDINSLNLEGSVYPNLLRMASANVAQESQTGVPE